MYFDFGNHSFGSNRFYGVDRLPTSVGSFDEWFAFGKEFRRKHEGADCKLLAVPRDHCLSDVSDLDEEGVFRPVFLIQLRLLGWRALLSS
jgi:hypothetical protein